MCVSAQGTLSGWITTEALATKCSGLCFQNTQSRQTRKGAGRGYTGGEREEGPRGWDSKGYRRMIFAEQGRLSRQEEGHQQRRGGGRGQFGKGLRWGEAGMRVRMMRFQRLLSQGEIYVSLCREDPLEEGMATLSSVLAWRIPCTEEPGGRQSMGSQSGR